MRYLARVVVAGILTLLARIIAYKYHPKVVMVTGSVGKTSTKDALAAVLQTRFFLRASEKSHNSEFGVPFTIIGVKNPWKSLIQWFRVFREAFALILLPNHYPNLLVLEVGADRPGDLHRILNIVTPDVLVVTSLPEVPVHVEAYASPEAVREEEFSPAYVLPPGAPLIVHGNDSHAMCMAKRVAAELHTFGTKKTDTLISEIDFYHENGRVAGMQGWVFTPKGEGMLIVRGSVGEQQLLPAAAALTTALALGIEFSQALEALHQYDPPPGRGRVFAGKNSSVLIDDTYNSSPAAIEEALHTLATFPNAGRRIAVLGDMLELGRYSVGEHERIGALARRAADIVVTVGVRARAFKGARAYDDSNAASAAALLEEVKPGDVILIKGSQSIRTERIVEALLADKADLVKLVRQEKEWRCIA